VQHFPAYAFLTELRDQDGIKVIANYAGLLPAKRQRYLPASCPLKFCTSNPPMHMIVKVPYMALKPDTHIHVNIEHQTFITT